MAISKDQRNNLQDLLNIHAQYKHLNKAVELFRLKNRSGKAPIVNELLDNVEDGRIDLALFLEWMNFHQIDGNNYFFVYDLSVHSFTPELLNNLAVNKALVTNSILDVNVETIEATKLVDIKYDSDRKRGIFSFISPAEVIVREKDGNNSTSTVAKSTYWTHVIVDINNEQIIAVINPTSRLISVSGIVKTRAKRDKTPWEPIADHHLSRMRSISPFNIGSPGWVYEALFSLAEDGTYHNNPQISIELSKYVDRIDEFSENLLAAAKIEEQASLDYLRDEMKQVLENLLIDKYGIIPNDDQYMVFEQLGDNSDTFVYISARVSNLQEGPAAKVAKATRSHSDVSVLGVERTHNGQVYRLVIAKNTDGFYVKNFTSRFTEEVVVYDAIGKINSYRRKIQFRERSAAGNPEVLAES